MKMTSDLDQILHGATHKGRQIVNCLSGIGYQILSRYLAGCQIPDTRYRIPDTDTTFISTATTITTTATIIGATTTATATQTLGFNCYGRHHVLRYVYAKKR